MADSLLDPSVIESLRASTNSTSRALAAELIRFESQVAINDLEMAMVRMRRALELAIRSACAFLDVNPENQLHHLIANLRKQGVLPPVVERHCRVLQEFGNLGAHTADAPAEASDLADDSISLVEIQLCAKSLGVIASWYKSRVLPRLTERCSLRVLSPHEITLRELSQAAGIDVHVYPAEYRGKPEVLLSWHRHNPEIFTLVIDVTTNHVVGCLTVMPLHDRMYARLEAGEVIDVDLPVEAIRRFDLPDFYKLYVASIVVDPTYQGSEAFRQLYESYLAKLLHLAQRDIFVTEILADVITSDGERLAEFIGMVKLHPSQHGSTIARAILLPPALRVTTRLGKQLLDFYKTKYDEFRDLLQGA